MAPQRSWSLTLAAVSSAVVLSASAVAADTWNERTELTFSAPIMIPGVTLQPGTYVFTLAPAQSTRHVVQVYRSDGGELVAMTQAVPIRRQEPQGHTIVTVNPTDRGIPALKAWFYPHSTYGHEFIYPEKEARHIAERSKTIVLSVDIEGTNVERGMLRLYHPSGARTEWRSDADTAREWEAWLRERAIVRSADAVQGAVHRDDGEDDAGTASRAPVIMDPGLIGAGTSDLVGALVNLKHVQVLRMAHGGGFFVDLPGGAVLVVPSRMVPVTVRPGQFVSLQGAVAKVPDRLAQRITPPAGWNDQIYVAAAMVSQ